MGTFGVAEIILIAVNVLLSLKAFSDKQFFNAWTFETGRILQHREYHRIITSGFIHVSGGHLLFNMLSLYFFAGPIETYLGTLPFVIIYFGSLIGGNLFSLLVHRHNPFYRAVGASGAVSGVIFAAIALFPGMELAFLFIPIPIPAWLFGLGFVLYSIYGIRSQRDNIGHEAHLGGALLGLLIAVAFVPEAVYENTLAIVLVIIPSAIFIILLLYNPNILTPGTHTEYRENADDHYQTRKAGEREDLDYLLDKIRRFGRESLSPEEEDRLKKYSDQG